MKHESRTIIIDVDGVLVAHTYYDSCTGERFKSFHSRDNRAIKEMRREGYRVILMTASSWGGIKYFADIVGAEFVITKNKMESAKKLEKFIAICDDSVDIELLQKAELAFAPRDNNIGPFEVNSLRLVDVQPGIGCVAEMWEMIKKNP